MGLLVLFGVVAIRLPWGQSPAALALMLLTTALAGAALWTILGTCIKTAGQASGVSILLGMLLALLGGCWLPLEVFPETVRAAMRILPTTWPCRVCWMSWCAGRMCVECGWRLASCWATQSSLALSVYGISVDLHTLASPHTSQRRRRVRRHLQFDRL